jgi:mannose/fructose/N-acetylgalactosamine-specific phosphotransferase system component IID
VIPLSLRSTWRTLALQASFNRIGMQRTGWWVGIAPWLRRRDESTRREWLGRQRAFFNTNPYLAPVLLGARCRIEEDHSVELADRVEVTMQRTLGSLGDSLSWRAVRPVWFLATALAGIALGPVAVLVAWLIFGVGVLTVHRVGLVWGYRHGLDVVDRLAELPLYPISNAGRRVAAILAGAVAAGTLALSISAGQDLMSIVAASVAVAVGATMVRFRRGPEWMLLGVFVGLILFARWTGNFPEAVVTWR